MQPVRPIDDELDAIGAATRGRPPGLAVELGTGAGRLAQLLAPEPRGFVGLDRDRPALLRARARLAGVGPSAFVVADIHHLPLRAGVVSFAIMVRVYHGLDDPDRALAEIARVLRPAGQLVVLVHPRPSLRTLAFDIWAALRRKGRPFRSLTFSSEDPVPVDWSRLPGRVERYATTRERFRRAGFVVRREMMTGYEEIPGLRRLGRAVLARSREPRRRYPWAPAVLWTLERRRAPPGLHSPRAAAR